MQIHKNRTVGVFLHRRTSPSSPQWVARSAGREKHSGGKRGGPSAAVFMGEGFFTGERASAPAWGDGNHPQLTKAASILRKALDAASRPENFRKQNKILRKARVSERQVSWRLAYRAFRLRAMASRASLSAVRRRSVSRLSQSCLPLASASSTFTRPL